jgi:hypothetical protein
MPDFSSVELDDFDNAEFRKTYLAAHDATLERDDDPDGWFTFCWPRGFMMATSHKHGEDIANLWGCVFIYLWQYKKVHLPDVSTLVWAYIASLLNAKR